MIVKTIKHFGDKTTGETYKEQLKREIGDIFECDDNLATERIENGFVKKASVKEIKEYKNSKDKFAVIQEDDGKVHVRPVVDNKIIGTPIEKILTTGEMNKEQVPLPLEEATIEQLFQIAKDENISLSYPKDNTAKDVIIETITNARNEQLNDCGDK